MTLRSDEWFHGTDEVGVMHRVAVRAVGFDLGAENDKPVIGIADSSSMFNPCNLPLRNLVAPVSDGVAAAGGVALAFPVMSLGEDLMKPTAMLYRNLLSMEVEEYVRSNPIDGLIILGNCDKSIPGALMGALSADIPTLVVNAGGRPVGEFRGRRIGTGTDLWRAWEDRRARQSRQESSMNREATDLTPQQRWPSMTRYPSCCMRQVRS
jgi:dihydroxyacid dehydratase/phosphogluconate dehydratase